MNLKKIINYSLFLSIPIFFVQNVATVVVDRDNELLLIDKFSKNYKSGDIVAMIDPIEPERSIVRKVIATQDDFIIPTVEKGYFLHKALQPKDSHNNDSIEKKYFKIQGPTPQGFIIGKVLGSIWPL